MQIPSFISTATVSTTEVAKPQQTSPIQNAANRKTRSAQDKVAPPTTPTVSSTTIKITGLTSPLKPQGAPGINMNQLNSMLDTSFKMQSIRHDASIPEEAKKKMLKPLEQVNKDILSAADAKAEQEEKSKIIEASNEDAGAIRKAGEEIAASAEAKNTPPVAPQDPAVPASTDDVIGATKIATGSASQPHAPTPPPTAQASSFTYSVSPPAPAVGENVDTHA